MSQVNLRGSDPGRGNSQALRLEQVWSSPRTVRSVWLEQSEQGGED